MNNKVSISLKVIGCVILLFWALYTFRILAVISAVLFCITVFLFRGKKRAWIPALFLVTALILPWQPYAVTLLDVDGGPKIVACCPGAPYRDWEGTVKKQKAGECKFCSDISTGFNPRYFLVW